MVLTLRMEDRMKCKNNKEIRISKNCCNKELHFVKVDSVVKYNGLLEYYVAICNSKEFVFFYTLVYSTEEVALFERL